MYNRKIFACKQCQRMYLQCNAYAVIEERQTVRIDEDGLEMVDDSEILNTVTKQYRCMEDEQHDIYLMYIEQGLYNLLYPKIKEKGWFTFKLKLEETAGTLDRYTHYPQELMDRLFDEAL